MHQVCSPKYPGTARVPLRDCGIPPCRNGGHRWRLPPPPRPQSAGNGMMASAVDMPSFPCCLLPTVKTRKEKKQTNIDRDKKKKPKTMASPNEQSPLLGQQQQQHQHQQSHQESEADRHDAAREGLPEMAKRLHILLPAMGIGMFLCALDQLLVVATYATISSDLQALNRTSWVSTA